MWTMTELVAKHSTAKRSAKAILLALAHRADKNGFCYPSIRRIALDIGVDQRTVQRGLRKLESMGELQILKHGGKEPTNGGRQWTNQYRILVQAPSHKGATTQSAGGGKVVTKGVAIMSKGGGKVPPESNQKRELKLIVKKSLPEELDYGDFYDPELDPIELANRITWEEDPRAVGFRKKMLGIIGEDAFRRALSDAWGIIKGDQPDRPGAVLTNMLKQKAHESQKKAAAL